MNKPLDLQATGNPNAAPQTLPQALNFAPAPQQQVGSQTMGLLGALAGLGMNIASAVQGRGGAAGQGTLQFANQQLDQYGRNERENQQLSDAEKQANALLKQATDAGIRGSDLAVVRSLLEARDVPAARSEIDRLLSVLRQQRNEKKAEDKSALNQAKELLNQTTAAIDSHPVARPSIVADFLEKNASPEALTSVGSVDALLGQLKTDSGKVLYSNAKDRKKAAQEIVNRYREADPPALARFFGYDGSEEDKQKYKRAAINKYLETYATPQAVEEYQGLISQKQEYQKAVAQLLNPKNVPLPKRVAGKDAPPAPKAETASAAKNGDDEGMVSVELNGVRSKMPAANLEAAKKKFPNLKVIK